MTAGIAARCPQMPHDMHDFAALVLAYRQVLYRRALQLAPSPSAADDLVQDTVERALRASARFEPGTNIKGWLLTIMQRIFIDARRRCMRETLAGGARVLERAAPEPDPPPAWEVISSRQLRYAVSQLGREQRALMRMFLDDALSYRQLSDRLGVPIGTVGTRLLRARQKMRSLLERQLSV